MANSIAITSDIPVPAPKQVFPLSGMFPWREMNVGDSFFSDIQYIDYYALAYAASKKTARSFVVRRAKENGIRGFRVWRLA